MTNVDEKNIDFSAVSCSDCCDRDPCIRITSEEGVEYLCRVCLDRRIAGTKE